jgi:hypothetical protein
VSREGVTTARPFDAGARVGAGAGRSLIHRARRCRALFEVVLSTRSSRPTPEPPRAVCHTDDVVAVTVALRRIGCSFSLLAAVLGATLVVAVPAASAPLRAPKTTNAQDTKFFTDVAEADPALASYEQKQENVALRALLTDGSAFCALLTRGGGLDAALVEEAMGVRGTESQTHLPLSVTTFNTIESVALLTLCPTEQKLVPASVRTKIRTLGKGLGKRQG